MDILKKIMEELEIPIWGVTNSQVIEYRRDFLEERKKANKEIEFEEKEIELRITPNKVFEDVQEIIVIGIPYRRKFNYGKLKEVGARLDYISIGEDYHRVVDKKLDELAQKLEKEYRDFKYKKVCDTEGLLDREIAYKAGLGQFGKNSLLINSEYGSYFVIGYLLTNLKLKKLEKNVKEERICQGCNLCVVACPTKAINEDYTINHRDCLSYLTQSKEEIKKEHKEKFSSIYGCSICQEVCPYNKEAKYSTEEAFNPVEDGILDIEKVFKMSKKEFLKKYDSMSGAWRGKNLLLRNGAIILGNRNGEKSLEVLIKNIDYPSEFVREEIYNSLYRRALKRDKLNIDIEKQLKKEKSVKLKEILSRIMKVNEN